jgi:hypothetical protein
VQHGLSLDGVQRFEERGSGSSFSLGRHALSLRVASDSPARPRRVCCFR